MKSIKLNKKVGTDGILHLDIPVEIIDTEVEIMVIYQQLQPLAQLNTPEELGYPPNFFEETYGEFEEREKIL